MEVSKNMAKFSQLDVALNQVKSNPQCISEYLNTIQSGFELIDPEQVMTLKCQVINGCLERELNLIPSEAKPICMQDALYSIKLLGKCFEFCEGEKAPGINEFPGYLVTFKWAFWSHSNINH